MPKTKASQAAACPTARPAARPGVAAGVEQRGGAVAEAAHAGGPFLGREIAVAEVAQHPVQRGVVREQGLGGREAVGADVVLQGGLDLDQEGRRGPVQRDGQPVERLHGAQGVVGPPVGEKGDAGEDRVGGLHPVGVVAGDEEGADGGLALAQPLADAEQARAPVGLGGPIEVHGVGPGRACMVVAG